MRSLSRSRSQAISGASPPTEIFSAFLRLGVTSFGGPIAHIGFFRSEFVVRRNWLDEAEFADIVGLCQVLPGPASSQTGFAIGLFRGGAAGGLAAWAGFTLPSAMLMVLFAYGAAPLANSAVGLGLLHGLKLVAAAIVGQAIWGMARAACPDRVRTGIALFVLVVATLLPASVGQVTGIGLAALAGLILARDAPSAGEAVRQSVKVSRRAGAICLAVFIILLLALPALSGLGLLPAAATAFYRSGALVFGGGHVVLPLLRAAVVDPGWVSDADFLAGYGAAQAVPGPLFTFAAYLGAMLRPAVPGLLGAAVALVAIFLPGLLLTAGALPWWHGLSQRGRAAAALRGVNAGVVGLLAAAFYDPVWTGAVTGPKDFAVAAILLLLLLVWRLSPVWIVGIGALTGLALRFGG